MIIPGLDLLKRSLIHWLRDLEYLRVYHIGDNPKVRNALVLSFRKFENLDTISLRCKDNFASNLISIVEIGLIKSQKIERDSLRFIVSFEWLDESNVSMEDIELYVHR